MMFRLKGWLPKRVTGAKAIFQAWTEKYNNAAVADWKD